MSDFHGSNGWELNFQKPAYRFHAFSRDHAAHFPFSSKTIGYSNEYQLIIDSK